MDEPSVYFGTWMAAVLAGAFCAQGTFFGGSSPFPDRRPDLLKRAVGGLGHDDWQMAFLRDHPGVVEMGHNAGRAEEPRDLFWI